MPKKATISISVEVDTKDVSIEVLPISMFKERKLKPELSYATAIDGSDQRLNISANIIPSTQQLIAESERLREQSYETSSRSCSIS